MTIIPKAFPHRFRFRNRIQTKKIRKIDKKQTKPNAHVTWQCLFNHTLTQTNAWLPNHGVKFGVQRSCLKTNTQTYVLNRNLKISDLFQKSKPAVKKTKKTLIPPAFGFAVATSEEKAANPNPNSQAKFYPSGYPNFMGVKSGVLVGEPSSALFGKFALIFKTHGKLSAKFIQTVRLDIAKAVKKKSRVWLRLCADSPVTKRPVEARMGKGKGSVQSWEAAVKPGQVYFEFDGLNQTKANQILNVLRKKSPTALKLCPKT